MVIEMRGYPPAGPNLLARGKRVLGCRIWPARRSGREAMREKEIRQSRPRASGERAWR